MKANVNDRVLFDGEVHKVLRVHITYEIDGICIPVDESDIELVRTLSDDAVLEEISKAFGMTPGDIQRKSRTSKLTSIRYAIYYHLHIREGWSYRRIGAATNRIHPTCFKGVRRFQELLDIHDREAVIFNERLANL